VIIIQKTAVLEIFVLVFTVPSV